MSFSNKQLFPAKWTSSTPIFLTQAMWHCLLRGQAGGPCGRPWREAPAEKDTHVLGEGPSMDLHLPAVLSFAQSQGSLPLQKSPECLLKPSDGGGEMEGPGRDRFGRSWRWRPALQDLEGESEGPVYSHQALHPRGWEGPAC